MTNTLRMILCPSLRGTGHVFHALSQNIFAHTTHYSIPPQTFFLVKDEAAFEKASKSRGRGLGGANAAAELTFLPDPKAHNGNSRKCSPEAMDVASMLVEDQSKTFSVTTPPHRLEDDTVQCVLTNDDNKVVRTLTLTFKIDLAAGVVESRVAIMTFEVAPA